MQECAMRTTLAIDDDVLAAAKAIARQRNQTIGKAVSELARCALRPPANLAERNGVPLLPVRKPGIIVTAELVNALRDESP
jgi:hypothetical protein